MRQSCEYPGAQAAVGYARCQDGISRTALGGGEMAADSGMTITYHASTVQR